MHNRSLAVMLLVLAPFAARADGWEPKLTQWRQSVWSSDQALVSSNVTSVAQDTQGYLWIGTYDGLARFDGRRFVTFSRNQDDPRYAFPATSVRKLAVAGDGTLFAGMNGEGVVTRDLRGFVRHYTEADGLPGSVVRALAWDAPRKRMWIGTTEGLYCWADGRLEGAVSGLPKAGIECLYADTDGSLWISLDQAYGLYLHAPDGDLSRPALGLPEGAIVKALLRDASSRLWVATRDHGAFRLDGGKLWGGVASGELPERKINAVVSDPSGAVWLATDGGIWRDSGGSWENLSEREGLANNLVEALLVDREGNVWAGTSRAGLVKLSGSKVLNFTAKEGLLPGAVNAVWADADGSIWIGGDGGLSLLRGGSVRPSPESELLKGVRVRHIMRDSRGTLWISSYGEGALYELPASGGYRTHGVGDGLPGQRVRMSLEDSRGRIWVATTTGLALREGDGWRSLTRERGLSLDYILGLAEAKDGSILAVTDGGGVNRIDPDTLEVVGQWKAPDGVAAGVVFKALPRGDAVWLATASGLTLRGPAGVRHFGRRDGLPADAIFDIVPDGEGLLWLSSSAGLVAIDEADALSGSLTITMALGANAGISGGLTAASWGCGSPDGRLWFPGVAGAVSLDPRRIPTNDTPPLMVIEAAELDGAYVAPVTVSIAPGVKRVVFRYTGLSFVDPESVRFRTKLEGFDDDWSYMEDRREQSYTNLPPGEYRFYVEASNNDGVWSSAPATLKVEQRAAFTQTAWFWLLVVGTAAALAAAAYTAKMRANARAVAELEGKVRERTKELADEKEKSDLLLLNILPEPIAARLKEGEASIVDDFPSASILFADIVKFSSWAGSIGSRELVAILGDLFSRMDTLCGKHGAEKIKTLGDAYMAVAGLPVPRADHADALVALAVDFQRALAGVNKAYGLELQMRVGINTGPVVAGIIGTRKFVYDLWGNAVNLASRMESTCPAGCIQISDSSYRLLSDRGPWLPRGRVPVKNCGEMEAWVYKTRWAPARESGREASARLAERN